MPTLKLLPFHTTRITTPVIELIFFGERHKFIVDTGAEITCISQALFSKFSLHESTFAAIRIRSFHGAGGIEHSQQVPVKINFLGKVLNNISVALFLDEWAQKHPQIVFSGLLGQDVMRQFKQVVIDYEKGVISFL